MGDPENSAHAMDETDVIIIGGGLTGLTLAHLLTKQKIKFILLEARNRLGGRIYTHKTTDGTPVEMGATWYFSFFQNLLTLLREMGVEIEPQYGRGRQLYEGRPGEPPRGVESRSDEDGMYRLKGGTKMIIDKLYQSIDRERVLLGKVVKEIITKKEGVEVVISDNTESEEVTMSDKVLKGKRVVTTIPPQLLAYSIKFTPSLSDSIVNIAKETHTWMGDAVKGGASFPAPFWRQSGLAGALYSRTGPMVQMYDMCSADGQKYALGGFMADSVVGRPLAERRDMVKDQLVRMFGEKVNTMLDYKDTIWKEERFTMPRNKPRIYQHKNNGHKIYQQPHNDNKLFIGGTETSPQSGGYMEGAVNSAHFLAKLLKHTMVEEGAMQPEKSSLKSQFKKLF